MGYIGANGVAILLATLGGLAIGGVLRLAIRRPAGTRGGWAMALAACLAEAWLASILAGALIIAPQAGPGPWAMALASAIVIWTGFVLPTLLVSLLQAGIAVRTTFAHAAHWLLVMLAQAAILQAVGLTKPG